MVGTYSINLFTSIDFHTPLPKPSLIDVLTCPLSVLLCLSSLPLRRSYVNHDLWQPLLEDDRSESHRFNKVGFLSQITFSWLNNLFRIGRLHIFDLQHIPSTSQSETAEVASSLKVRLKVLVHPTWVP